MITHSATLTTETSDEDFVVLVNKVQATVIGNEGGNLLAVLNELNTHTLADSRVGLLSFNATVGVGGDRKNVLLKFLDKVKNTPQTQLSSKRVLSDHPLDPLSANIILHLFKHNTLGVG